MTTILAITELLVNLVIIGTGLAWIALVGSYIVCYVLKGDLNR